MNMETIEHQFPWLELMDRPAFCVKDGVVAATNSAAENYMIRTGQEINDLLADHRQAYEEFTNGCLYLSVNIDGLSVNTSVTRTPECDVFVISQDAEDSELQALSLAAQQLRVPLANVMTVSDRLLGEIDTANADSLQQANQLNHNLFQLMRIISNMSDAGIYRSFGASGMETVDLVALVDEIMEKIQTVSQSTGISVSYTGIPNSVFGLANPEKLERAIYNLLSNALKFSDVGSTIDVRLTHSADQLTLTVCNLHTQETGDCNYWNRYRRKPSIEDSRYGLGLGMTLISAVATSHGGTVLIDHPTDTQTRVTLTIAVKKSSGNTVRSNILRIGDYAGGRDKGLLEFSEILPPDAYKEIN